MAKRPCRAPIVAANWRAKLAALSSAVMRWRSLVLLAAALPSLACEPYGSASTSATAADGSASAATETTGATSGGSGEATEGTATDSDGGLPPGFWPGVVCAPAADEEGKAPRVYFDLRAGKEPDRDYFRLPFPADVRLKNGGLDLEGFPRPPTDLDPAYGAVVERWLKHLEGDLAGFAVNGAILFRSSAGIGTLAGVTVVDITPSSPSYGDKPGGLRFRAENGTPSRNNYICENWLAIETVDGVPLRPATTYAVVLDHALKPAGGGDFVADDDFAAMLADAAPADASAKAAWQTFKPLRDFLISDRNLGAGGLHLQKGDLVGGTVFTTGPNLDPLLKAREVVDAQPLVVSELHLCEAWGDSPCSTAPGLSAAERELRRCDAPSPLFHEIHGRVRLPVFQEGIAPYASVGGAIAVDASGPIPRSTIDACFALTIPRGPSAPETGWPALIYADGTNGTFRGAIGKGIAGRLANAGVATLSIEGVLHGERRGDSDEDGLVAGLDIYQLVFNVFNPHAARDTNVQGALDHFTAIRLAREWSDGALLDDATIRLDPDALAFMGHSLGANTGALALPFAPELRAAVFSGGGSNLVQALLAKGEPKVQNPISGEWMSPLQLLQLAFQERPDRPLTAAHPMLILLNTYVNRSDADNTSRHFRREPLGEFDPRHLLLYIGHVDAYTPLRAAGSLAIGAGVQVAPATLFPGPCDAYADPAESIACGYTTAGWLPTTGLPATKNVGGVTAVARMLTQPPGKDGHFVAFEGAELDRIAAFVISALSAEAPTVDP